MSSLIFLSLTIATFSLLMYVRRLFIKNLSLFSWLVTRSLTPFRIIYSLIFFPGVVIHELSHFFAAAALGVRTGEITFFPKEENGELKLGSVMVAKTDVIRISLVGTAPFLVGITLLFVIIKIGYPEVFTAFSLNSLYRSFILEFSLTDLLLVYLLFAVSNTMVLSRSDTAKVIPAAILIGSLAVSFSLLFNLDLGGVFLSEVVANMAASLAATFGFVALINTFFLVPVVILVKLLKKIKGVKIALGR